MLDEAQELRLLRSKRLSYRYSESERPYLQSCSDELTASNMILQHWNDREEGQADDEDN